MDKFKLVSPFQPTGDQPTAIEQLVEGLNKGYKHQTLLGATGTGKSLGHDDPVFIVEKRSTALAPRLLPIGDWIDSLIEENTADLHYEGEALVLDLQAGPVEYYAQAFNPGTCAVDLYPIRSVIRHTAPATMYRLKTRCGRSATLTGDHNLWVLREGQLELIKTSEARSTDYVPLPESLLAEGQIETMDTLALLAGKRLFVQSSEAILAYVEANGPQPVAQAFAECGLVGNYAKLSAIRRETRGQGIEVSTFLHLLERTDNLAGHWDATVAWVGGKASHNRLPARLPLTPELLRLLGYYIAEGNHQPDYVIIASRDETIRRDVEAALSQLGLPFSVRSSSDYQVSSHALGEVLARLGGATARHKRLPDFWPQLPETDLAQLLRAYFDGDGTVGQASYVSATTASAQLASDLAYALLRFGIWARLARKWKRATNGQHAGDWYYDVIISGQADLRRFEQAIGFSVHHKQQALAAQLRHAEHSNVDVVPMVGDRLRWLRLHLGLSAQALGARCQLSRSTIQFVETGKRFPRRSNLLKLLTALRDEADNAVGLAPDWRQVWENMWQRCQVRWTPVASVEPVEYHHPFVYDLCVPGAETFLAGTGGFFVHNTFCIASVIERVQRPALVLAHNKTLAAQLYAEYKAFFPNNAVEYYVSYYDYYQPEAYIPRTDTYIEKDTSINEEIERLRLAAASALFTRRDVVIVASVSCIYATGNPHDWGKVVVTLNKGERQRRDGVLRHLVDIQYERNDFELRPGRFRVRGDTLEIMPASAETAYRVEFFGDEIDRLTEIDTLTGEVLKNHTRLDIFPAKQFITPEEKMETAIQAIEQELAERLAWFNQHGKLVEAQRLEQRTRYDLEMLREMGHCAGIENYSRHMDGREPGSPPWTLIDYFPADYVLVIDESHMSLPQIRGMYHGDRSRKEALVEYGFRLPSALDNRPLRFEEFEARMGQTIYTSATPGPYELEKSQQIVQQIIRPTGLVDPEVIVKPVKGQVDDLVEQIRRRVEHGERVLVTTLTKRMAEDLSDYLLELGLKVHYLHSEVQTIERVEILRDLRLGVYDVVIGINLLREGLDLPEVSLVAILDADKEGFLRSEQALIQTIGRAARHVNGTVIMYADKTTDAMRRAIDETNRRRQIQLEHNAQHGIVPASIVKAVHDLTEQVRQTVEAKTQAPLGARLPKDELTRLIKELEKQMKQAAAELEFEKAALLRDQILELRQLAQDDQDKRPEWERLRRQSP